MHNIFGLSASGLNDLFVNKLTKGLICMLLHVLNIGDAILYISDNHVPSYFPIMYRAFRHQNF